MKGWCAAPSVTKQMLKHLRTLHSNRSAASLRVIYNGAEPRYERGPEAPVTKWAEGPRTLL